MSTKQLARQTQTEEYQFSFALTVALTIDDCADSQDAYCFLFSDSLTDRPRLMDLVYP